MSATVKTRSGKVLADSDLDRIADEAERGFDLSTLTPRRGRPPLGGSADAHSPRIAVRIPEDLHRRALQRAADEGRSISDVVRELLESYASAPDSQ
jgi:hypothetical protein